MDGYLKIGDVAKLNEISVDALRHYDKLGLFKADYVRENGYRYYRPKSLESLDFIIWLRMNGLSLDEIKKVMSSDSLEFHRSALLDRIENIDAQIEVLQQQRRICATYANFIPLISSHYPETVCYFDTLPELWYVSDDRSLSLSCAEGDEYQMVLKRLYHQFSNPTYYYNSIHGGIRPENREPEDPLDGFYPTIFCFGPDASSASKKVEAGKFAVTLAYGANTIEERIGSLLEFVSENLHQASGDFYLMKIWDWNDSLGDHQEAYLIQVRVEER